MSNRSVPVHGRDYVAVMPEDELRTKLNQYRGWIESGRRRGNDTYDVEIEYCYLVDELRMRENRKRLYEEYMRNLPPEALEDYYYSNGN